MGLKVGDRVKVIDNGHTYTRYYVWLEENSIDSNTLEKWKRNASPKNGDEFIIRKIAPHLNHKEDLFLIEDDNSIFIMGTCEYSLQLVEEVKVETPKKEDNFKVKCLRNHSSLLTKGKIYEFIDGQTIWDNGDSSNEYLNCKEFIKYNDFDFEEYIEEEKEEEELKVGDLCIIEDNTNRLYWADSMKELIGETVEIISFRYSDNLLYQCKYVGSKRKDYSPFNQTWLFDKKDLKKIKKGSEQKVAIENTKATESRKVFVWDEFKGSGKHCVLCETEEEAEVFCRLMHEHGMTWCVGESYLSDSNWERRGDCGILYYGDGEYDKANEPMKENKTQFIFSNWFTKTGELKHIETKTTKVSPTKTSAKPKPKAVPTVAKDSQKDLQKETNKQTTNKERVEENNMKNNLSAIFGETVGKIIDGMVAVTFGGEIAIKRNEDEYVRFNAATNTIENQMDFVMKEAADFLFLLPVNEVQAGDVIKKNNTYYQVVGTGKPGGLTVVGIKTGTRKTLIQETNIMGFSFYFKVVNLFSVMSGTGISGINPMLLPMLLSDEEEDESMLLPMLMCGGMGALTGDAAGNTGIMGQGMNPMMMAMMMSDKGKKGSGDSGIDMKSIMMMNMMGQQGQGAGMNPMMMAMMMGNGKMDMKTMMMMNMMSQQQVQPVQQTVKTEKKTVESEKKADAVSGNPNVVTVPPVE